MFQLFVLLRNEDEVRRLWPHDATTGDFVTAYSFREIQHITKQIFAVLSKEISDMMAELNSLHKEFKETLDMLVAEMDEYMASRVVNENFVM